MSDPRLRALEREAAQLGTFEARQRLWWARERAGLLEPLRPGWRIVEIEDYSIRQGRSPLPSEQRIVLYLRDALTGDIGPPVFFRTHEPLGSGPSRRLQALLTAAGLWLPAWDSVQVNLDDLIGKTLAHRSYEVASRLGRAWTEHVFCALPPGLA